MKYSGFFKDRGYDNFTGSIGITPAITPAIGDNLQI